MPRIDGIYSAPAGTRGAPDDLIESARYNAFTDDLAADLSAPLPTSVGGTGASNVSNALPSIGGLSIFAIQSMFGGSVFFFARANPPDGWLICDGRAVSRAQHQALFSRIGTRWGAGDGATTFNLPDIRGEFIRGADLGRGIDPDRQIGSPQGDQNLEHDHDGTAVSAGAHNHGVVRTALVTNGILIVANQFTGTVPGFSQGLTNRTTGAAPAHTHTVTINQTGTENRPRNVALLACIKT